MLLPLLGSLLLLVGWGDCGGMEIDLFVHKDKFGRSVTLDIGDRECTNVPRLWSNLTQSVDTKGSCVQFYDRKDCKGRIAVVQPFHTVHQMDLSLINFQNTIESLSPCGPKVPTGRYVVQSAVDASMLTVQKRENEFAKVNTLPPAAFIPKAQQWEVVEKQTNEYDIMPRIHETNSPVTYDGEAMKKGNFIRKVWKIESVGRGRYIIKSEWTGKCLYKTRIRTVEEHDCRAWSPNQEWVLRPLIAPTKAPVTQEPQLADGVNFQVPSRVVEKYLDEQKKQRIKEAQKKGASIQPYKIVHKKKNKNSSEESKEEEDKQEDKQEDEQEDDAISSEEEEYLNNKKIRNFRGGLTERSDKPVAAGPELMYSRPAPILPYQPNSPVKGRFPGKVVAYMDGVSPVYEDAKVNEPTFPNFLLHAISTPPESEEDDDTPKYTVTRKPKFPEPEGHPNYIAPKKKYDGKVKDNNYKPGPPPDPDDALFPKPQEKESEEEDEAQSDEDDEGDSGEVKKNDEDDEKTNALDQDDPASEVAGFFKLLLQGVSNRLEKSNKKQMTSANDLVIR